MADAAKTLEVLIKVISDITGAQPSVEVIEKLKKIIGETSESTTDLGKATEDAGEHAQWFNFHGKELHKILHELDHLVPGLGQGLKALFNPANLGMAATLAVFMSLKSWFEKWNEQHEQAIELSYNLWKAEMDGARAAKDAVDDFNREIAKAPDAVQKIEDKYTSANAVLEAQIKAHKQILDALKAEEIAGAHGDKSKEAEIERRYGDINRTTDAAAEQARIDQLKQERAEMARAQAAAREKADDARDDLADSQQKPEFATEAENWMGAHEKELAKALEYIKTNGGTDAIQKAIDQQRGSHGGQDTRYSADLAQMLDLKKEAEANEQDIDDWNGFVKTAKQKAEAAASSLTSINDRLEKLDRDIANASQISDINQNAATQISGSAHRTELNNLNTHLAGLQNKTTSSSGMTQQDIDDMTSTISELTRILPGLIQQANPLDAKALRKEFDDLRAMQKNLSGRMDKLGRG